VSMMQDQPKELTVTQCPQEAFALNAYLAICQRICEQRMRDGEWPWDDAPADSPTSADMVDSDSNL